MDLDEFWGGMLDTFRQLGPVEVKTSRFAPKPALWLDGREIAHWDGPGAVDLRITATGWTNVREQFGADPAVRRDSGRRDWIELRGGLDDVERLRPLLAEAVARN